MKTNPHQLVAFAHVIRAGSFSSAARKLGVTQSALSQQVGKLEERVGARLMTRSATGLDLTKPGAELFELADQLASLTDEIDDRLSGYSNFDSGHLSIIANAPQPALAAIAHYGQRFPKVEINFTLFDWTRTTAMLSEHSVDLAFITRPRKSANIVYKKLCDAKYVMYLPASHPLAQAPELSLHDIGNDTMILPETGSLTQKVVSEALEKQGISPARRLNTTTFPVMKEAILQGAGVGVFLADAAARHEGLAQVPITELTQSYEIFAAAPKHKIGLRLVRSFWDDLDDMAALISDRHAGKAGPI